MLVTRWLVTVPAIALCTITALGGCTDDRPAPDRLPSFEITPDEAAIAVGETQQFKAIVVDDESDESDVTGDVDWSSSDESIVTINSSGLATAVGEGEVTIVAEREDATAMATLTVSSATLDEIIVSPSKPSIAKGTTQQFVATGKYSDGQEREIKNGGLKWSSSSNAATIDSKGLATGANSGKVTITATLEDVSGRTELTVTDATLASIAIEPASAAIAKGTSQQLKVIGKFSDATTQELTSQASWSSSAADVARVGNSGEKKGLVDALKSGDATITASHEGKNATATINVTDAVLRSITVEPAEATIPRGTNTTFVATGKFSDDSTQDLSSSVAWTTSDATVASISNAAGSRGEAHGLKAGSATITATRNDISGTATLTVTGANLVSLSITPPNPTIANGTSVNLVATGTYSDDTTLDVSDSVTWNSSDDDIASVSDDGEVTGHAMGSVMITAQSGESTTTTTVNVSNANLVSIAVTPVTRTLAVGITQQYVAMGHFSDNTNQDLTSLVSWTSSEEDVASISNASGSNGEATAESAGTTQITAQRGSITSNPVTLTVTAAQLMGIAVLPVNPTVADGLRRQFTARGTYSDGRVDTITDSVLWESSDTAIATISNLVGTHGEALAAGPGNATITASLNGVSGTTTLTVSNATLERIQVEIQAPLGDQIAVGTRAQFIATGYLTDGTHQDVTASVLWSSGDTDVIQISNDPGTRGLATAVGASEPDPDNPGEWLPVTITATFAGVDPASTTLSVSDAVLTDLEVTPLNVSLPQGLIRQFRVIGEFSDNTLQDLTNQAAWISEDSTIAQVSNIPDAGLVETLSVGTVDIVAALANFPNAPPFVSAVSELTVSPAEVVSLIIISGTLGGPKGVPALFAVQGTYTDGTSQILTHDVDWTSSDENVLYEDPDQTYDQSHDLDDPREFIALAGGTATVTASILGTMDGNPTTITAAYDYTVTDAQLVTISVTGSTTDLPVGRTREFTAYGHYTDAIKDITDEVTWTSSNSAQLQISSADGSEGEAIALQVAEGLTVSAQLGTITGTSQMFDVSNAEVDRIEVTPANLSIANGLSRRLTATAIYSDNSRDDVTDEATWDSADDDIATVSNAPGTKGRVTAHDLGTVSISAEFDDVTGDTDVTVDERVLSRIEITPINDRDIPLGSSRQFIATGVYSDAYQDDISDEVQWQSSKPATLSVNNLGLARARVVDPQAVLISASLGGITDVESFTVTNAVLESIVVSPSTASQAAGYTQQYTAEGYWTDDTHRPLTPADGLSWSVTSMPPRATIHPLDGLALAGTVGAATIVASVGTITDDATLTVTAAVPTGLTITPATASIADGQKQQFTATVDFSDGSDADVTTDEGTTWTTSAMAIASVSNVFPTNGEATGESVGTAMIGATYGGQTATAVPLTVTAAILDTLNITTSQMVVPLGESFQFAADAELTDNSTSDVTDSATWTSSDDDVASVTNGAPPRGTVFGADLGTATITVSYTLGAVTRMDTFSVTVDDSSITALDVSADPPDTGNGCPAEPLALTGTFGTAGVQLPVTDSPRVTYVEDTPLTCVYDAVNELVLFSPLTGPCSITFTYTSGSTMESDAYLVDTSGCP